MAIIPKGQEPYNVKKRIDTLFYKLNEAYPDKVIVGLQKDHKKWDETAREISKQLGYDNKNDFLTAYGYKIEKSAGGRPSNDHMAIIEELKKRYPNGSPFEKIPDLAEANPDLAPKFKTLSNKANDLFGMTLANYLISEGILGRISSKEEKIILSPEEKAEQRINKYKHQIDEVIIELKKRYPDYAQAPGTFTQLKSENTDLPIHNLENWIQIAFEEKAIDYLAKEGIINHKNYSKTTVSKNIARAQDKKPLPEGVLEFVGRNFVHTHLSPEQEDGVRDIVLKRGGNIQSNVGYKTDYLIAGGFGTTKYDKAQKLVSDGVQIQIISYFKFMRMVSEYDDSDKQLPEFVIEGDKLVKYTGTSNSVIVPNNINIVGKSAFYGNDELTEITVCEGVTIIEKGAFEKCGKLKRIHLPKTLLKIEDRTFESCESLQSIEIPDSVVELGKAVFHACKQLKEVYLPKKLKTWGEKVFWDCISLERITLSKDITLVPVMTFAGCESLKTIVLNDKISKIEMRAFEGCISLRKVSLPSKVKKIDYEAFFNCTALKEVELSENLTKIEGSCFEGCTSLSKIVMYDALKSIGACAFKDCVSLTDQSFIVLNKEEEPQETKQKKEEEIRAEQERTDAEIKKKQEEEERISAEQEAAKKLEEAYRKAQEDAKLRAKMVAERKAEEERLAEEQRKVEEQKRIAEEQRKALVYQTAMGKFASNDIDVLNAALADLQSISGWGEVDKGISSFKGKIAYLLAEEKRLREEQRQRELEQKRLEEQRRKEEMQRKLEEEERRLEEARKFEEQKRIEAENQRKNSVYLETFAKCNSDDIAVLTQAIASFESISDWKDSKDQIKKCREKMRVLIAAEELKQQEKLRAMRRENKLCQHCGGILKGLFKKVCTQCGKPKDY